MVDHVPTESKNTANRNPNNLMINIHLLILKLPLAALVVMVTPVPVIVVVVIATVVALKITIRFSEAFGWRMLKLIVLKLRHVWPVVQSPRPGRRHVAKAEQ